LSATAAYPSTCGRTMTRAALRRGQTHADDGHLAPDPGVHVARAECGHPHHRSARLSPVAPRTQHFGGLVHVGAGGLERRALVEPALDLSAPPGGGGVAAPPAVAAPRRTGGGTQPRFHL